jgi:hypothetical protein
MRALQANVVLMGVFLIGCGGDDMPTPPHVAVHAGPSRSSVEGIVVRPLSGRCDTAFDPPPLPPPPVLRQVDVGTCQMTHLGRVTMFAVQDINLVTGTQTSVEVTFTAPNGDILRAASAGTSVPNGPGVAFSATMTFVGGTGRFARATGRARLDGAASFVTNTASFTFAEGWIAY